MANNIGANNMGTAPMQDDDYHPQFPALEDNVHNMIESLHQNLPPAIDKLIEAYDELVTELRAEIAKLQASPSSADD